MLSSFVTSAMGRVICDYIKTGDGGIHPLCVILIICCLYAFTFFGCLGFCHGCLTAQLYATLVVNADAFDYDLVA